MKLIGVVLMKHMIKDKLGEQVPLYTHIGYKIEGTNQEFQVAGLPVGDKIVTTKQNTEYLSIEQTARIASNLIQIDGLNGVTGGTAGVRKLYDYPISVCRPVHISPSDFQDKQNEILNDINVIYFERSSNGSVDVYYKSNINNNPEHDSMYLLRKVVGKRGVDGKEKIFGYEVSLSQSGATKPVVMSLETIAENAKVLKPKNFIVTSKNGSLVLKGIRNSSLKELDTLYLAQPNTSNMALNGSAKSTGGSGSSGLGLSDVCRVLKDNNAYFLRLVGETKQHIEGTDGTLYLSGVQVAKPNIDYSWGTLNANFKFTCLATVANNMGSMIPVCYTRSRSMFNSKFGALALLEHIYAMVDNGNKDALINDLSAIGLTVSEDVSDRIKSNLPLINMGLLGGTNYVVIDIDLSKVSLLNTQEVAMAKSVDMFELLKKKQVYRGLKAYLDTQIKKVESKLVPVNNTQPSNMERYYNQFPNEIQVMLDALKIDRRTGVITFTTDYSSDAPLNADGTKAEVIEKKSSSKSPIAYTIPDVPEITAATFAKKPLDEIIASNNKKPIKEEIYQDLFKTIKNYVVNYENILSQRAGDYNSILKYLQGERQSVEKVLYEIKRTIWIYNQYAIKSMNGELAIYDNMVTNITKDTKKPDSIYVERTVNPVYKTYMIKIDTTALDFSDRIKAI